MNAMKKFNKEDQRLLAIWAADCAERVLPYFERIRPKDERPRKAIKACRTWVRTGIFKMADIRKASLDAHAAARKAKENDAACFAARAAGQAVATAHVPEHAFGASYYALKVVAAANPANAETKIAKELDWESRRLPKDLRQRWHEWQERRLRKHGRKYFSTKREPDSIRIRKAVPSDSAAIAKCFIDYDVELTRHFPLFLRQYRTKTRSLESIRKIAEGFIKDKHGLFLVVEENHKIGGFGYVSIQQEKRVSFPNLAVGVVRELWLKKELRGKGISSRLWREFNKWFRKRECPVVIIEVLNTNPAKIVYEKWGCTPYCEYLFKQVR